MRGITPSLGALATFSPSSTRIPHLGYHLAKRRTRHKPLIWPRPAPRCVHSISLPHTFSPTFPDDTGLKEESVGSPVGALTEVADTRLTEETNSETRPEVPDTETFDDILIQSHSERLLRALIGTDDGKIFIETASPDRFSAALAAIDPSSLIYPFEPVYRLMTSSSAPVSVFSRPRLGSERFWQLSYNIRNVFVRRWLAGHRLGQEDCTHLLQLASALRDGRRARSIWYSVATKNGLDGSHPLEAYNAYMHAVAWSNTHYQSEYKRLRATPYQLSLRRQSMRPSRLAGHRVGGKLGLRHEVLTRFQELVDRGFQGDEKTFTNLMVAMGREADIAGVKSILRSVYNIDVDLLMQVDEEEVETPTFYKLGHPLRPTTRLLYTLAHVFGANSELPLAVKLVDFVARQYVLPIPHSVWAHLIEWAFVLITPRTGKLAKERSSFGSIDLDTFESIWTVMTSTPHNIQPDLIMLSLHSRVHSRRWRSFSAIDWLETACKVFDKTNPDPTSLTQPFLDLSHQILDTSSPTAVLPSSWFDFRQAFILAATQRYRDTRLLQLATHEILTSRPVLNRGQHHSWAHRTLPDLITRYRPFLRSDRLNYRTPTGTIHVSGLRQYDVEPGWGARHWQLRVVRALLDDDKLLTCADLRRALDAVDQALAIHAPTYSPNVCAAKAAGHATSRKALNSSDWDRAVQQARDVQSRLEGAADGEDGGEKFDSGAALIEDLGEFDEEGLEDEEMGWESQEDRKILGEEDKEDGGTDRAPTRQEGVK